MSLNIRSGAGTTFSVVERAEQGASYVSQGPAVMHGGLEWHQVSLCGSTEIIGWMAMHPLWQDDCECANAPSRAAAAAARATGAGRWPLHYDAPKSCTSGPASGAAALAKVLKRHFPAVTSTGIFNCRSVRGGSSLSEHGEGRAVDFMVPTDLRHQNLADFLVANAGDLGIQAVIYNRRVWGYGRWNWRAYSGQNPHVDHVHTGLHWDGARGLRESDVEAVFSGTPATPGNPPPPPPTPGNPPPATGGRSCTDGTRTGTCMDVSSCTGTTARGLCPGASNIRCCFTEAAQPPPPPPPAVPQPPPAVPQPPTEAPEVPQPPAPQPPAPQPQPPQQEQQEEPSGPSCRDREGNAGTCMNFMACGASGGVPKRGFCGGPANIQCCFRGVVEALGRSSGSAPRVPVDSCVRISQAVNLHEGPSASSPTLLVAFVGEEFIEEGREGSWVRVSNSRGTGYGFHSFFQSCDSEITGRSLAGAEPLRIGDAPRLLDDWAIGLVTGLGVALVVGVIIVAYYIHRRKHAAPGDHWKSMEEPLIQEDSSAPRSSARSLSPRLSVKGGSALVQPSPGVGRRAGKASGELPA